MSWLPHQCFQLNPLCFCFLSLSPPWFNVNILLQIFQNSRWGFPHQHYFSVKIISLTSEVALPVGGAPWSHWGHCCFFLFASLLNTKEGTIKACLSRHFLQTCLLECDFTKNLILLTPSDLESHFIYKVKDFLLLLSGVFLVRFPSPPLKTSRSLSIRTLNIWFLD